MKKLAVFTTILVTIFITKTQAQEVQDVSHPDIHKVRILELLQTTSYTYLLLDRETDSVWVAVPKMAAEVGDTYYYHGGMEMRDFKSRELNRTFGSILFLNGLVHPDVLAGKKAEDGEDPEDIKKNSPEVKNILPPGGGISISELINRAKKYEGKKVLVRGKVIKYNSGILKRNWVHLDDGSCETGKCDLTVTTIDETMTGDIITVEGTVTLNKDYGAGYFYSIIMEDAKIIK